MFATVSKNIQQLSPNQGRLVFPSERASLRYSFFCFSFVFSLPLSLLINGVTFESKPTTFENQSRWQSWCVTTSLRAPRAKYKYEIREKLAFIVRFKNFAHSSNFSLRQHIQRRIARSSFGSRLFSVKSIPPLVVCPSGVGHPALQHHFFFFHKPHAQPKQTFIRAAAHPYSCSCGDLEKIKTWVPQQARR